MPAGLWPTPRHLLVVILDAHGKPRFPIRVAHSPYAWQALFRHLAGTTDPAVVVSDNFLHQAPLARLARDHQVRLWIAPHSLVHAIRKAAGLSASPPKNSAALLARLPMIPALRQHLKCLDLTHDPRQQNLF